MENYSLIFELHINTNILSTRFKVSDYLQSVFTGLITAITTTTHEQNKRRKGMWFLYTHSSEHKHERTSNTSQPLAILTSVLCLTINKDTNMPKCNVDSHGNKVKTT